VVVTTPQCCTPAEKPKLPSPKPPSSSGRSMNSPSRYERR